MIVKIQLPLVWGEVGEPNALVYNEDRSFETRLRITDDLREVMGDDKRAFFEVSVGPVGTPEEFQMLRRVVEQGW